jgi:hypothetical protein
MASSDPVLSFILVAAFLVLVVVVLTRYRNDDVTVEEFQDAVSAADKMQYAGDSQFSPSPADRATEMNDDENNVSTITCDQSPPSASAPMGQNEDFKAILSNNQNINDGMQNLPKDCFPKDQLSPEELLPGDANSTWAQVNPAGQGDLQDSNFLNAGHHIGVNTVGQSLRNSNMGLRSEPPNPQMKVSPWNQTTIEPDSNRRGMEIGGC